MSEEKNGYVRLEERDLREINAIAEAWTRCLPAETMFEIAKRINFHFTCHVFMNDKMKFEDMKEFYNIDELDINRTPNKINALTESIIDKLDEIMEFQTMTDEEMEDMGNDSPLPDAEFFRELGLN